ncbi:hypothetical protein MM300_19440 [Evansella sp. LMS18]|uniref:hypothetical protein n=1 Tax=Evansella sp. LMS18 TaxID=2924033 RepID=UPI0020D0BB0A|nr:hypothetical protein [Evansella sp. LMS18]UTR10028.1 hypothetical protein MM300_19440 [Evansella sp. LMS18]
MLYQFNEMRVEETESNMISPDRGTVVFEVSSDKATPFVVTIERRGEEYVNTAKTLLGQKTDEPEELDEFLRDKAQEILEKKFE